MSPDQLEFVLTQYLDGTLPPEEVSALEQLLATDARAQALRNEHERLTALLRSQALPEMNWEELASDLSAVVTGTVDEADRAADQKLNAVLQSAIPLPDIRWADLTARISAAVDSEIAGESAEDQKLEGMLRAAPLPNVNWDRLSAHLSDAVAAQTTVAREVERPAVAGRIGWVRTASRLAMAACVVIAASLGIRFYTHSPNTTASNPGRAVGPAVAINDKKPVTVLETPEVEVSKQPAIAEISIGPSSAYAASSDQDLYRRGVAARAPMVIALPASAEEDSDHVPMFE